MNSSYFSLVLFQTSGPISQRELATYIRLSITKPHIPCPVDAECRDLIKKMLKAQHSDTIHNALEESLDLVEMVLNKEINKKTFSILPEFNKSGLKTIEPQKKINPHLPYPKCLRK